MNNKRCCVVTLEDYKSWEAGKYAYDFCENRLVNITDDIITRINNPNYRTVYEKQYLTFDNFCDYNILGYDTFSELYQIDNNKIVVFGYYGYI